MQVCGGRQAVVGNDVCLCALQAKGIDLPFDGSGGTCDETSWPHAALPTRPALCRRQRTRRWRQARPLLLSSAPPPAACCTAWPTTQTGCTATSRWGPAAGAWGPPVQGAEGGTAQRGPARRCDLAQLPAGLQPSWAGGALLPSVPTFLCWPRLPAAPLPALGWPSTARIAGPEDVARVQDSQGGGGGQAPAGEEHAAPGAGRILQGSRGGWAHAHAAFQCALGCMAPKQPSSLRVATPNSALQIEHWTETLEARKRRGEVKVDRKTGQVGGDTHTHTHSKAVFIPHQWTGKARLVLTALCSSAGWPLSLPPQIVDRESRQLALMIASTRRPVELDEAEQQVGRGGVEWGGWQRLGWGQRVCGHWKLRPGCVATPMGCARPPPLDPLVAHRSRSIAGAPPTPPPTPPPAAGRAGAAVSAHRAAQLQPLPADRRRVRPARCLPRGAALAQVWLRTQPLQHGPLRRWSRGLVELQSCLWGTWRTNSRSGRAVMPRRLHDDHRWPCWLAPCPMASCLWPPRLWPALPRLPLPGPQAGCRRRCQPAGGRCLPAGALLQVPAPGLPGGLAHVGGWAGRRAGPASRAVTPATPPLPAVSPCWPSRCAGVPCRLIPPTPIPCASAARAGPLVDSGFQANLTALLVRLGSEHPHHSLYQVSPNLLLPPLFGGGMGGT